MPRPPWLLSTRPARGPGGRRFRATCPDVAPADDTTQSFIGWAAAIALVYGALLGTGQLLLGRVGLGVVGLSVAAVAAVMLARTLPRLWASSPAGATTTER